MAIKFQINTQALEVPPGSTLFDYAEQVGVHVPTSCVKQGKCRECLVEVVEGMDLLCAPTEEEDHLEENFRLSCRARVIADSGTVRCHTMRRGELRILDEALNLPVFQGSVALDPAVTRHGDRILLEGEEITCSRGPIYGIAMDLGTTTVVLRLIDLESGRLVASQSLENPQRFGGSDVMARIKYDTDHKGRLLQRTLLGYLKHAIEDFPCEREDIYEMVVAANSTMRDIFFGLNVYTIGQKPYWSITEHEVREGKRRDTILKVGPKKLRLPMHPNGRIYGLPVISGHVGADAAACLLAINMHHEKRLVALMDIGTNTELLLGNRDGIFAASCPAGPAFEGGILSCGMPGLTGAIERIRLGEDGRVNYTVIGEGEPEGICGSGLVDLLSELLRTKRINELGRFIDESPRFVIDEKRRIFLNEEDISQLAQAKGANVAGLHIILERYGATYEQLDHFFLAGGFARHLDVAAARRMGLIPNLPHEKITQVGNASIEGATIALCSLTRRRGLEETVGKITHVELETHPHFFEFFVEGCQYAPVNTPSLEGIQ